MRLRGGRNLQESIGLVPAVAAGAGEEEERMRIGMGRWGALVLLGLGLAGTAQAEASPYGTVEALERVLDRLQSSDEPEPLGDGPVLRKGDRSDAVRRLEDRLAWLGDFDGSPDARFDADTEQAVRRFQGRHGLKVDGLVGPETRSALGRTKQDRIARLKKNLEARRSFERPKGSFVLVNVPDFELHVLGPDVEPLSMRVAVGKEGWGTPPITDRIERVVINPAWNVPASIVAADLAPKVARNPGYLAEKNMVVLDGWGEGASRIDPSTIDWGSVTEGNQSFHVRQQRGPQNPLGRIKFLFPNQAHIFLHDTPHRSLFVRQERDGSHGCIRVEAPFQLADLVLAGTDGWDRGRVEEVVDSGERATVALASPFPVRVVYWTAWVDEDGTLHEREDLYDGIAPTEKPV